MICKVTNCQRDDSKRRLKMGYCDGHYQRLYFRNDLVDKKPVKQYASRGAGVEFLKKLKNTKVDTCVNWPYGKDSKNYGAVFYKGKRIKAHRVARIIYDGIENPPKDVFACHKCDNSLCVNPRHIYFGDAQSNRIDMFTYRT